VIRCPIHGAVEQTTAGCPRCAVGFGLTVDTGAIWRAPLESENARLRADLAAANAAFRGFTDAIQSIPRGCTSPGAHDAPCGACIPCRLESILDNVDAVAKRGVIERDHLIRSEFEAKLVAVNAKVVQLQEALNGWLSLAGPRAHRVGCECTGKYNDSTPSCAEVLTATKGAIGSTT